MRVTLYRRKTGKLVAFLVKVCAGKFLTFRNVICRRFVMFGGYQWFGSSWHFKSECTEESSKPWPQLAQNLTYPHFQFIRRFSGAYAGGGCTGHTCTPPPGKKVPLRNVQKRRESSAQLCWPKRMCTFRSDTTKLNRKKYGKKKKIVKGKG